MKTLFFRLFTAAAKAFNMVFWHLFYGCVRVQPNKVFVMTYDNNYICNPSYIAEELRRRNTGADIVWAVDGASRMKDFPTDVRTVGRGSFRMFYEMASAKIWLDNAVNCVWYFMPKKKGQYYLNTWHGSLGIKKLSGNGKWLRRAATCNKRTDYCISNSRFETDVYRTTFWPDVPVLLYGHPRNDIFFDTRRVREASDKVRSYYGLGSDVKICLYAPTFRDDGDMSWLDMDYRQLKDSLEQRFGGCWVILVRLHWKNRGVFMAAERPNWLIEASGYIDMQELMAATDIGITDYSSWAYDFILTRRPMFLYARDIEKYDGDRGFYYSIYDTPFPVTADMAALVNAVAGFDEAGYRADCETFLQGKGCMEDGHAAERTADKLLELMAG